MFAFRLVKISYTLCHFFFKGTMRNFQKVKLFVSMISKRKKNSKIKLDNSILDVNTQSFNFKYCFSTTAKFFKSHSFFFWFNFSIGMIRNKTGHLPKCVKLEISSMLDCLLVVEAFLPSKQLFSLVGMEPLLPGYYQFFSRCKCVLLKDTTRQR